ELWLPGPGTSSELGEHWLSENLIGSGNEFVSMNGKHVFQHAVVKMPEVLKSACDQSGYKIEDIDLFFFHQANLRINQKIVEDLGLDPKKVYNTIHKYGNTTAATIPLGMVDAYNAGVLKKGMLIALVSFGAGFTWGASIVRY
ncbi:MAG TPA: 3-oxoacyl-[acyl-carrier-protein] synthase III C-terminal domain-containing protein, partial [Pseudobdellovibrionaceae bacterium]|nr:3-oxoacyl-[acyl-carrier-protein] synthase III C-terminal domain-containing protein [Pseudobdellovibrionaceae bacterium]